MSDDHTLLVQLDQHRWVDLLDWVGRPTVATKHGDEGGFQTRRLNWFARMDARARSIRLTTRPTRDARTRRVSKADVDWIATAIIKQHKGGFQNNIARIFTDTAPPFTNLPIEPRPVRSRAVRMTKEPTMPRNSMIEPVPTVRAQTMIEAVAPALARLGKITPETSQLARFITRGALREFQEKMVIDPAMAKAMWTLRAKNRAVSERKITRYHNAMVENRWKGTHQGLMFDRYGYLRDGQHRVGAIIKYGKPMTFWVCFGCDPDVFDAVDQGDKRTAADMLTVHDVANATTVSAAAALLLRIERKAPVTDSNEVYKYAYALIQKNDDFRIATQEARRLRPLPVRAAAMAMVYHWIKQHSASNARRLPTFWENFVTGASLGPRDARLVLREYLNHPDEIGKDLRGGSSTYDLGMRQAGAVILTWNKWVVGRTVTKKALFWDAPYALPEEVL